MNKTAKIKLFIVYVHTCIINGRKYVGITSRSATSRWKKDGKGYKHQPYFWNAIQKYGWDNFKHEIVAENLPYDDACKMEKELINTYKSNIKGYGYNIENGGECEFMTLESRIKASKTRGTLYDDKPIMCLNDKKIYNSVFEVATELNLVTSRIKLALKRGWQSSLEGYHFIYLKDFDINKEYKFNDINKYSRKIVCTDNGEIYNSIRECVRRLKIPRASLQKVLRGEQTSVVGHHFKYLEQYNPNLDKTEYNNYYRGDRRDVRPVLCIDTDKKYNSASECSKDLNIDLSSIHKACKGIYHTAGGYHFKYVDK